MVPHWDNDTIHDASRVNVKQTAETRRKFDILTAGGLKQDRHEHIKVQKKAIIWDKRFLQALDKTKTNKWFSSPSHFSSFFTV